MPRAPRNGYVIAPKTDHGMRARFACRDGYTLNGDDVTECSYGNWSGDIPACDEGEDTPHAGPPGERKKNGTRNHSLLCLTVYLRGAHVWLTRPFTLQCTAPSRATSTTAR